MVAPGNATDSVAVPDWPALPYEEWRDTRDTLHLYTQVLGKVRLALSAAERVDVVLKEHRARFLGRSSPVQFFWGTFDLALTRFSGQPATPPAEAGIIPPAQRGRRPDLCRILTGHDLVPEEATWLGRPAHISTRSQM